MRLHFPQAETEDALLAEGETSIGCDRSCTVVVRGQGVEPVHAVITNDLRGVILWVRSSAELTHVNGRPVREKALLHVGDTVNLGSVRMDLLPHTDACITAPPPIIEDNQLMTADDDLETRYRALPPRALLRGVSGAYFGKVVPIPGRLVIGRGEDADLNLDEPEMSRRHAQIEVSAEGIYLRDLGSANGTFVNGVQVRDAVLFAGDQIAFDRNRFLIEAPGTPTRAQGARAAAESPAGRASTAAARQTPSAAADQAGIGASDARPGGQPGNVWLPLLIGAGIAAVLALLLFGGGR